MTNKSNIIAIDMTIPYIEQIEKLLYALFLTNLCHGCVHNSDESKMIKHIMDKAADLIDYGAIDRWWVEDEN